MKYADFLKFLDEFKQIRSYQGKIRYANEQLNRIGGGSGRIVYDIDGEKVLKLAKNAKGIAQNEAEASAGAYDDYDDVLTKIFDYDQNDAWIVAEKAKKINEKRFKEITGFSIDDVYRYVRNFDDANHGKGEFYRITDPELKERLDNDEEFVQRLTSFTSDYSQNAGDMGRVSSYGEVLRNGIPSVVLTDYGLSHDVYDTHYNPARKQKFGLYELFGFHDGNDDILSDIGNVGANERHGMWAIMPYGVSDGNQTLNEEFINFVSKRDKYPKESINNLPYLTDCFHECVNNIKETLKHVDNKKQFYNNLLTLQEYLIEQNYYNRDPLLKEEYVINEDHPNVEQYSLEDQNYANQLATAVAQKLNLGNIHGNLGGGANGFAYEINNNLVLKITSDVSEADAALISIRNHPKTLAKIFNLYKVVDTDKNLAYFAILQENIIDKPIEKFNKMEADIEKITPDFTLIDLFSAMRIPKRFNYDELLKTLENILTANPEANISQADREDAYGFMVGLLNIRKELIDLGIKSKDYVTKANLGYKDGMLKFFDVGGYVAEEPRLGDDHTIMLPESESIATTGKFDKETADKIANRIKERNGYGNLQYKGAGEFGFAYDIGSNRILKVTSDKSEVVESLKIKGKQNKHLADIYDVYEIKPKEGSELAHSFVIIVEKLKTNAQHFKRMIERLDYVFTEILGIDFNHILDDYVYGEYEDKKDVIDRYLSKNQEDSKFYYDLLAIADEAHKNGIESQDYHNTENLGYKKDGSLGFFDMGFGDYYPDPHNKPQEIEVDEDGSSKFSTDSEMGQDGFPPYNNGEDSSPMIQNDLNANSAMYNETVHLGSFNDSDFKNATNDEIVSQVNNLKKIDDKLKRKEYLMVDDANDMKIVKYFIDNNSQKFHSYLGNEKLMYYVKMMNIVIDKYKGLSEDLEYNHVVGDATDDEFEITEDRKKAWVPGSQAVTVKKKCRLGGLPDGTSVACNQGDINNLEFSPLTEESLGQLVVGPQAKYDVYKNPTSIRNFVNDARGFIDTQGNFYLMDNGLDVPHSMFAAWLNRQGVSIPAMEYWKYPEKAIAVQRYKNTNNVLMSDAYSDGETIYNSNENMITAATQKNPSVNFMSNRHADINDSDLEEGVGDKYAEKKWNMKPEFDDFENKYQKKKAEDDNETIIHTPNKFDLIKNPKNLKNIGENVRGVIDREGNLYVELHNATVHQYILDALHGLKIINRVSGRWSREVMNEFITVRRSGNSNRFFVGDSSQPMYPDEMRDELRYWDGVTSRKNAEEIFQWFMNKAKQKNPNIDFVNELEFLYNEEHGIPNTFDEGVGDKYAEKAFGIKPEFDTFEKKFREKESREENEIVYDNGTYEGMTIIKNPNNLNHVGFDVRGVIDKDGNLYVEDEGVHIHDSILHALDEKGLVKYLPEWDENIPTEFITVQRYGDNNVFVLGESNHMMLSDEKRKDSWVMPKRKDVEPIFQQFMDKAKQKNPNIDFVNEFIVTYRDEMKGKRFDEADVIEEIKNMVHERVKSYMPKSKTVTVKKKCRIGGLGNTSVACNQGDIKNLEFGSVNETGVGDKYLEKKHNIKPEFSDFEKKYNQKISKENNDVVYEEMGYTIIKNPTDLTNVEGSVRGFIDKNGNLYIELSGEYNHDKILDFLAYDLYLIKDIYNWHKKMPTEFITIERLRNSKTFILGETNKYTFRYLNDDDGFIKTCDLFLNKAKQKNPTLKFVNNLKIGSINEDNLEVKEYFSSFAPMNENIMSIQNLPFKDEVQKLGGKIYSVGGAVRDEFLGLSSKDLDVLISGIPIDKLQEILSKYGRVSLEGDSFAVLIFTPKGSTESIDIAIPRTETPTGGGGHQDFDVKGDHTLSIEKDLERRDITINAIAKDMDGNIIDPFGGQEDLKSKTIRVVNPDAFSDDPLRMLRAVQFASRFDGFQIEPKTMQMIIDSAGDIKKIKAQRLLIEFGKIITKGNPRVGVELLASTGLFKQIFGNEIQTSQIGRRNFESVKTMAEFLFLMMDGVVQNPSQFYLSRFSTEDAKRDKNFKEIVGLERGFDAVAQNQQMTPVQARSVAHNMFDVAPQTLQSQVLPQTISTAAQELAQGKYPKTVNELAVNGNDLMNVGLRGKEIGVMQKSMLIKVYADIVRNNKEDLLSLVNQKPDTMKEGFSDYDNLQIPSWNINGQNVSINFFVQEYDKWNNQGGMNSGYENPSHKSVLEFLQNNYEDFSNDNKLRKELYWKLIDRDLLKEDDVKRVSYSAIVLDEFSRTRLIESFQEQIPEDWEVVAHHMTINMGAIEPEYEKLIGRSAGLIINDIAFDDMVIAVGVESAQVGEVEIKSRNVKPHITLAVNRKEGGKPYLSNKLTDWKPLKRPMKLTGVITEV